MAVRWRKNRSRRAAASLLAAALLWTLPVQAQVAAVQSAAPDRVLALADAPAASAGFHDAVRAAVESHPRVNGAIAVQREELQRKSEVRAGLLPTIGVDISAERSLDRRFDTGSDNIIERSRPKSRTDATLSGEQLLFDFGATTSRLRAADARIGAAEAQTRAAAAEVALEAVRAHYTLVGVRLLRELGDVFVARHREILSDVSLRFEQGFGPRGDVARVEAYLADAQGQIARFRRDEASAEARFYEVFNSPPPENLVRPTPARSAAASRDEAIALAQQANTELDRAARLAEGAAQDYRAAKADRLPRVSLALDATRYDLLEDGSDYDVRGRIVSRYDLFAGGAGTARVGQSLQRMNQALAGEEDVRQIIQRDAYIAWEDVASLEDQAATLRQAYLANQRTRVFFLEQFRVARGSLLDVLQAEQDAFEAAVAYVRGMAELDIARYALLVQTGEVLDVIGVSFSFNSRQDLFGR